MSYNHKLSTLYTDSFNQYRTSKITLLSYLYNYVFYYYHKLMKFPLTHVLGAWFLSKFGGTF